jgi:Ca2+-binding EF-hand superfamily protein
MNALWQTTIVDKRLLDAAFKGWDTQGEGGITPKQIKHLMTREGACNLAGHTRGMVGGYMFLPWQPILGLPPGISMKDVDDLIQYADSNRDGLIDYRE